MFVPHLGPDDAGELGHADQARCAVADLVTRKLELMEFKGSRALVTGASSGMGEVFARELARRGADLVHAARSRDKLEVLASELRESAHVSVHVEAVDLSEPGAALALAARLGEHDLAIDVLVNNAGRACSRSPKRCGPRRAAPGCA